MPDTLIPRTKRPDPEVWPLLVQMAFARPPATADAAAVAAVRRGWQTTVRAFGSFAPITSKQQRRIPGPNGEIVLDIYTPVTGAAPRPVLVWLHGGGFVAGDAVTGAATGRALADRTGAVVIAVDYRLAPEHSIQASLDDCVTAVHWLSLHAAEIGGDPDRLAVGGDSAGGGLAALAAQRCAADAITLVGQLLIYPATDLSGSFPSAKEDMPGALSQRWMQWMRAQISTVTDLADPALSAVYAPDLAGLPPAIVVTAGFDPLRDEGLAYAARLTAAGVSVRHMHYPGQIHGFLSFDRVLRTACESLDRVGAHLQDAFAGNLGSSSEVVVPGRRRINSTSWWRPSQRWHETKLAAQLFGEELRARWARREGSPNIGVVRTKRNMITADVAAELPP